MAEEGYVKFLVRFPAGMLNAIKREAERNDRTVTGEIIHRLRVSLRADERKGQRPQD